MFVLGLCNIKETSSWPSRIFAEVVALHVPCRERDMGLDAAARRLGQLGRIRKRSAAWRESVVRLMPVGRGVDYVSGPR